MNKDSVRRLLRICLAVLAAAAQARDPDGSAGIGGVPPELKGQFEAFAKQKADAENAKGSQQRAAFICSDDDAQCRCPGAGRRFRAHVFGQGSNDYMDGIVKAAAQAMAKHNIAPDIGSTKVLPDDGKGGEASRPLSDFEDLCKYVKKAFTQRAPTAGVLPVFIAPIGPLLKGQLSGDTVGVNYPPGRFKENCESETYNFGNKVTGLPANDLILIDAKPDVNQPQTFLHETGHAVNASYGGEDQLAPDVFRHRTGAEKNMMYTNGALNDVDDMIMTGAQTKAYCGCAYAR